MPRVPGDVPQVPFQPTQMPGYQAPVVQPSQNFMPQQLQQLAGGLQDVGQASSRIGSSMQRQELAEKEAMEAKAREQERIQARLQQEQDRLDETEAKNKINEYRKFAITKRTEFGRLEGASAPQQYSKYIKDIKDYGDELYKGLANDTQRKIFSSSRDIFEFDTTSAMDSHSYNENKRYQRETSQSSAQINSQTYTDAYVESVSRAKLEKLNEKYGLQKYGLQSQSRIPPEVYRAAMEADIRNAMDGQPEESIRVEIDKAVKATHANTLEALAAKKDFDSINEYISNNEKEIDPKTVIDYRKIAASTKASFDASKFAISIAKQYRDKNGYFGDEQYSYVSQYVDDLYASKDNKWDEETYRAIKTALRSLKEADSAIKAKVESALVDEAVKQIEFQKSAQAREEYSNWVESNRSNMDFNKSMRGMGIEIDIESPGVVPIVADDATQAEMAFAASNPVLYSKLEAAGKLKELRDNFKGGGKSDPSAVAEIERNINSDPSFLSNYDINKFDANYGLRLSPADYEMYRNKLASARDKSMESANVLSDTSMNLMINQSLLDNKLVTDLTGEVEKKDDEQKVAATKADIRHEWDRWSADFSKANSGKSPGREEFKDFLKSYWGDRKVTGIEKPVSEFNDEDLSKVFVAYTDRISNHTYSASLADIDEPLFDLAVARANKLNSELYAVESNKVVIARFATYAEAEAYKSSRIARERAANYGLSTQDLVVDKKPIVNTSKNSTDLGNIAMELLAHGEYKSSKDTGEFTLKTPDTSRRTNSILQFYGTEKSNAAAKDGIAGNIFSLAIASASPLSYEDVKKARQEVRVATEASFRKNVESLRDDIYNDQSLPSFVIDNKTAVALTGFGIDKLIKIGAVREARAPSGMPSDFETDQVILKTTPKFNDLVKETYDYTVQVLKKQGYR